MNPIVSTLQASPVLTPAAPTEGQPLGRPLRILVVDDSRATRAVLRAELLPLGAEVIEAKDGRAALLEAARTEPDMITLDVLMPDLDGYAVCRELKKSERTASIPVLMVASRPRPDERTRAFLAGASEYFVKPFPAGSLREFVQAVYTRHRGRRHQRVHVVVGNAQVRAFVERTLASHGYVVTVAPTTTELLESDQLVYDLLVLDLELPKHRAFDALLTLRDRAPLRRLPVIALTGSLDRQRMAVAFNSGAADVLRHPVFPEELVARIENQLRVVSLEQRLLEEATIDHLTGLFNRRHLARTVIVELKRATRHGEPLGILIADLDHFKQINDTHGHSAGDEVLRACAREIAVNVRATDVATRYGGEEFVILLPGDRELGLRRVAERIREAIAELRVPTEAGTLRVTVSIGGTSWEPDATPQHPTLTDLIEPADRALYHAKNEGRNRVVIADPRRPRRGSQRASLR